MTFGLLKAAILALVLPIFATAAETKKAEAEAKKSERIYEWSFPNNRWPGYDTKTIIRSPETSTLPEGYKVVFRNDILKAFDDLNLVFSEQVEGTCVGQSLGHLINFELRKLGLPEDYKIVGQQLYLRLQSSQDLLKSERRPSLKWGSNIKNLKSLLLENPKVCMTSAEDRQNAKNSEIIFRELVAPAETSPDKRESKLAEVAKTYQLSEPEQAQIRKLFNESTQEEYPASLSYRIAERALYPSCSKPIHNIDIKDFMERLKTFIRGEGEFISNGGIKKFLDNHLKKPNFQPLFVGYCQVYQNEDGFGIAEPISINPEDRIRNFEFKYAYFPWNKFPDDTLTFWVDANKHCIYNDFRVAHAAVIKGIREVRRADGSLRTDYLIEDNNGIKSPVPMWQNERDYHQWVEAKTFISNISSVGYIDNN